MILIYILIVLFVCLIGYQIILAFYPKMVIEGLENETDATTGTTDTTGGGAEYQPYQPGSSANQALELATQNQYNIEYLNTKVKEIAGVKDDIDKMKLDLNSQQSQITDLVGQSAELSTQLTGGNQSALEDEGSNLNPGDPTAEAEAAIAAGDGNTDQEEEEKLPL
jgi:hypothetical protein